MYKTVKNDKNTIKVGDLVELNKKYKIAILITIISLLLIGVILGFNFVYNNSLYDNYIKDDQKENSDKQDNITNDDINVYTQPVSTKKYNIDLVYIDDYLLCGEKMVKKETIYDTSLDDLKIKEKNKQEKEMQTYEIQEESNEKLIYYRKLNQNCPNHFVVKLENGKIVVYNIVSDIVKTKYQEIDIQTETIRPELMEELNVGIKANNLQELNFIIEDLES